MGQLKIDQNHHAQASVIESAPVQARDAAQFAAAFADLGLHLAFSEK